MSSAGLAPGFSANGSLAATGSSIGYQFSQPFNLTLSGTWVGTVALEASTDGGTTYVNCIMPDGTASAFTINGFRPVPNIYQRGVLYRVTFTRTSGTVDWRLSR